MILNDIGSFGMHFRPFQRDSTLAPLFFVYIINSFIHECVVLTMVTDVFGVEATRRRNESTE